MIASRRSALARPVLLAAFFASGVAALVYQTIWQRLLLLIGGADVYSVTIIVAAFMAGLGLGHLAGGPLADRLSPRRRVLAFVLTECAIAAFAAFSPWIFYDVLYERLGAARLSWGATATVVFGVTLWPTFLMGLSLPLACRIAIVNTREAGTWIPRLYGWNTIGAACGALGSVALLLRTFDIATSLRLGAALSLICGLCVLAVAAPLAERATRSPGLPDSTPSQPPVGDVRHLPFGFWLVVYALSGFVALSLEIVWFRVLGVALKSNAFTFGYLLAIYLAGLGLGALLARLPIVRRTRPAEAFFIAQGLIAFVAVGTLILFIALVGRLEWAAPLRAFLGSPAPLGRNEIASGLVFWLYGGLGPLLILPATMLMGVSFSVLQRAVQHDPEMVGRRVGWLQAANIVGSTAGALITGLVLIDAIGTAGTLRAIALIGAAFWLSLVWIRPRGTRAVDPSPIAAAVAVGVMAAVVPANATFWARLHAASPEQAIVAEDASGLVLLRMNADAARTTDVFISGISQSWLPYGGIHTALGALPALIHPAPETVAVVGLASGDTAFAIGGRPDTRRIDSIEIMTPQIRVLERLQRTRDYPALERFLDDPRVRHVSADARTYLRRTAQRYDIIEADALLPRHAGAGHLYSVEYFELVRDTLAPGGFAVTWTPTRRVLDSLIAVFPHVLAFEGVAIGSMTPIVFDAEQVSARLQETFTAAYYRDAGVDVASVLAPLIATPPTQYGPAFDRRALTDLNRDLFPQDEFARP